MGDKPPSFGSQPRRDSMTCVDTEEDDCNHLRVLLEPCWLRRNAHDGIRLGLNALSGVPTTLWVRFLAMRSPAHSCLVRSRLTLARAAKWLDVALERIPADAVRRAPSQLTRVASYE